MAKEGSSKSQNWIFLKPTSASIIWLIAASCTVVGGR